MVKIIFGVLLSLTITTSNANPLHQWLDGLSQKFEKPKSDLNFKGKVVSVSDGDTLVVLGENNKQYKVRLSEIDAPEKSQAFGQASKNSLSEMAYKRYAVASCSGKDQYDRYICKVTVDGLEVNKTQVSRGYAWVYKQYSKRAELLNAENAAREIGVGLWAESNPTPPWEYRRNN